MNSVVEKISIEPRMSAVDARRVIIGECLEDIADRVRDLVDGAPDAVHQLRVALRRARAAISLFARAREESPAQDLRRELRWLSHALAAAREFDVLQERWPADIGDQPDGMSALQETLASKRAEAYAAATAAASSERCRQLLADAQAWRDAADEMAQGSAQDVFAVYAARELRRRRKRVKAGLASLAEGGAEARHALRIACKKLRFGLELFAKAFPGRQAGRRRAAMIAALKRAQEALGELNDIAAEQALLEALGHETDGAHAFAGGYLAGRAAAIAPAHSRDARRALRRMLRIKTFWPRARRPQKLAREAASEPKSASN